MSDHRMGDWKFVCEMSGFEGWASDSALTWDGRRVLKRFLGEEAQRHPQEFVRGRSEQIATPWARPEQTDVFLGVNDVQPEDL